MFLCNFISCANTCSINTTIEKNMLNGINQNSSAVTSLKKNKKNNDSEQKKSRQNSLNIKCNDIRLKQNRDIKKENKYDPSINFFKKQFNQNKKLLLKKNTNKINPKITYPNSPTIKKGNQIIRFVYPQNIQKNRNIQVINQNIRYSDATYSHPYHQVIRQPTQSVHRKVSLSTISTTICQTQQRFQQNRFNKRPISQTPLHSIKTSHTQSTDRFQPFQTNHPGDNRIQFTNNYIMNIKKKEELHNFTIVEKNQSSLSYNNDSMKNINSPNNFNINIKSKQKTKKQQKSDSNEISSIKLIKQGNKKSRQVKFEFNSPQGTSRQILNQEKHQNIFRIVDTIKSIDQSVASCQHSYLDLKFMNNLNSNKLFSKLM